jgi:hypothetical protein
VLLFPIVLLLFIMSFFKKKPKLENYFNWFQIKKNFILFFFIK